MDQRHDVGRSKIRTWVPVIYFLSDAHIGSRAMDNREEHEKEVCSLLLRLGQDATEIYLLGDIFDFWYEFVWQKPEEYRLTLDTLKSLTERGITEADKRPFFLKTFNTHLTNCWFSASVRLPYLRSKRSKMPVFSII